MHDLVPESKWMSVANMKEFPEGILIYPASGPGKNRQSGILVACTEAKKYI